MSGKYPHCHCPVKIPTLLSPFTTSTELKEIFPSYLPVLVSKNVKLP
jgi:hypothetical protein